MFRFKSKRARIADKIKKKLSKVSPDYGLQFHPKTGYRFYLDFKFNYTRLKAHRL